MKISSNESNTTLCLLRTLIMVSGFLTLGLITFFDAPALPVIAIYLIFGSSWYIAVKYIYTSKTKVYLEDEHLFILKKEKKLKVKYSDIISIDCDSFFPGKPVILKLKETCSLDREISFIPSGLYIPLMKPSCVLQIEEKMKLHNKAEKLTL